MSLPARILLAAASLSAFSASAVSTAFAGAPGTAIVTRASPTHVRLGEGTTISGTLTAGAGVNAGVLLELQSNQAHGRFVNIAHTITGAGGEYAFAPTRPYETTRYRVVYGRSAGEVGPTVEVRVELPAYPSGVRIDAAADYISGREGVSAFAVVNSRGELSGRDIHRRFHSASVVKSMLLVAYLRKLADEHRGLDARAESLLYPMIHSSSNEAATAVLQIVGEDALDDVARDAGMTDYEPGGATWGFTEVSAADLARFFFRQDSLIPERFDAYARRLLSTIEPSESWGVPAVARPEFKVFFKGGWLPEVEGLVNQVARLERAGTVFALAVLSRDNPSMDYGEDTIEGVTARLLGRG